MLAESDDELAELGLKNKKSKGNKEQKQKAQKKARELAVPVKNKANEISKKREKVKAKAEENRKKNPGKVAAANTPEKKKANLAKREEIKRQKLSKKIRQENKKIAAGERKIRNLNKRKANLSAAMTMRTDIRKLPNKGLPELLAKCEAIREAKRTLKETNSPKRPFYGMRKAFLRGIEKQRDAALKVNGVKSCGAARKLAASLPADAPEPEDIADEILDSEFDPMDDIPIEVADAVDFEAVDAEIEAEIDAEAEMVDAGMDIGLPPAGDAAEAPDAGAAMAGDGSGCVILQADGSKLYTSLMASEAACKTTCAALEATSPGSSCSFNGAVLGEVSLKSCVITAADGSLLVNMKSGSIDCQQKCSSYAATHPGKSCSWDGSVIAPN